ncbi:glycine-rich domain-containing protein [Bartonella sp. 1-1C]|uniref:glycine-rich domain-containing protein n=1 Tax=Bartonella sp. 1-1C TaxID=515256 RepID=UPI0001F4CAFD|nr:hypothetical protein [Bartonella sp. 1-1C]ATO56908.1 hypothetical protein B11Cv2_001210 [Bartonella sp. 1-1C]CBI80336.1 conserved hypothetical protein [Bartonella sp. 1-1C]
MQEQVDLMQSLEQQDWINGTKTEHALISPVHLLASIEAHSSNSTSNGSCSCNGALKPIEILMTESGEIPWPEGVTDETEIEIWAWGGGGGGGGDGGDDNGGGGGGGGQHARVRIKGLDLKESTTVQIGRGGAGGKSNGNWGGDTIIEGIVLARGGGYGGGNDRSPKDYTNSIGKRGNGGKGGDGGIGGGNTVHSGAKYTVNESAIFSGGDGGIGGGTNSDKDNLYGGHGGSSMYGGGGGGGGGKKNGHGGYGGISGGGNGGNYGANGGGGGGGYFRGKDGGKIGGDGGDGAVLIKVYL